MELSSVNNSNNLSNKAKVGSISITPLNTNKNFRFKSFTTESFANPSENYVSPISELNHPVIGIFSGVFAEATISRNNRYYSREFWDKVINSEQVQTDLKNGRMIGVFEHPEINDIYDESGHPTVIHPAMGAFVVKELKLQGDQVIGEAYLLNTPLGRLLGVYFLARDKYGKPLTQLYISARGKTMNDYPGVDGVEQMNPDDYYLPAFDVVLDPGFINAKVNMTSVMESVDRRYSKSNFKLESAVNTTKMEIYRKYLIKKLSLKSVR